MEKSSEAREQSYTRRQFLKTSGLAVVGLGLSQGVIGAVADTGVISPKKVRMGIVGGGFGSSFQWHLDPNCIVEAVSDLREDRRNLLKQVYKCDKAYNSLEELIKDKNVDAVAIFTGAPDHVRHCVAALKAGKHVICAVPAAMTVEEAEELLATVKSTGLHYMMAETSYYYPNMISARKLYSEGKFGEIYYTEAEYHHPGLEVLYFNPDDTRTWRHGLAPMNYPTHCTSFLVGLTGERLVEVSCIGWGDDDPILKDNRYKNKFWNETAMFKTDKGHAFRVAVYWRGALGGCERAQWYGSKMSLFDPDPNGLGAVIRRTSGQMETDEAGFARAAAECEAYVAPNWAEKLLPAPMRISGGHAGAEPFLTHEFIDALVNDREPVINIYEALSYTVPGIIAHQSAMKGGTQLKIPVFNRA